MGSVIGGAGTLLQAPWQLQLTTWLFGRPPRTSPSVSSTSVFMVWILSRSFFEVFFIWLPLEVGYKRRSQLIAWLFALAPNGWMASQAAFVPPHKPEVPA